MTGTDSNDLHRDQLAATLRPKSVPSEVAAGWGDHRIRVAGVEVSFSIEDPGIQVRARLRTVVDGASGFDLKQWCDVAMGTAGIYRIARALSGAQRLKPPS